MTGRRIVSVAIAAALGLMPAVGSAHEITDPNATEIHDLAATVSADSVTVDGHALFGGQPIQVVGEDAAGDNRGAAVTNQGGTDITSMRLSWNNTKAEDLLFDIVLDELPDTVNGVPEVIRYTWGIAVDGGADNGGFNWQLTAMRTRAAATGNAEPYGAVNTCVPGAGGTFSCSVSSTLNEVVFDGAQDMIRFEVPFSAIGARQGSVISAWSVSDSGSPVSVDLSTGGFLTATGLFDGATHEDFVIPQGKRVALGIAPAGEPMEFDTPAALAADDSFSGTLAGLAPGDYDVGARACFADNCATGVTQVTVAG